MFLQFPMGQRGCPHCGSRLGVTAYCPGCGVELGQGQKQVSPKVVATVIALVVIFIVWATWRFA